MVCRSLSYMRQELMAQYKPRGRLRMSLILGEIDSMIDGMTSRLFMPTHRKGVHDERTEGDSGGRESRR